ETTAEETPGAIADTGGLAQQSQRITVLLVEDEDPLRQAVMKMLRRADFEVVEAANGTIAIEKLRGNAGRIDVILLDMTLPGASSQEVVAEAERVRPDIRVILTSAYSREMLAPPLSASQICNFIRKPFRLNDLVQQLRSARASAGGIR